MTKKIGFTLAEVLITLAIIGVVAALTIPTLLAKVNDIVNTNQKKVIEKRFVEGLNLYNTLDNGLFGKQYNTTYDFLIGLSKHYKMTSICDAEHIADCWPKGIINYMKDDGTVESVQVSTLSTPEKLKLSNDEYLAPASFINAAGIPFILAVKKNCFEDPDVVMKNYPTSCIDGLYDYTGAKNPNILDTDVLSLKLAGLNLAPTCKYTVGDVCWVTKPFRPTLSEAEAAKTACSSIISNNGQYTDENGTYKIVGLSKCTPDSKDYWLAAKIACAKQGLDLPNLEQMSKIASAIYSENIDTTGRSFSFQDDRTNDVRNAAVAYELTLNYNDTFNLWTNLENESLSDSEYRAQFWQFSYDRTILINGVRGSDSADAVCVTK